MRKVLNRILNISFHNNYIRILNILINLRCFYWIGVLKILYCIYLGMKTIPYFACEKSIKYKVHGLKSITTIL